MKPILTLLLATFLSGILHSADALDVAVPSDMFTWDLYTEGTTPGEYYNFDITSANYFSGTTHNYLVTLDWEGNIVYFRKPTNENFPLSLFTPVEEVDKFINIVGSVNHPFALEILDSGYTPVDTITYLNPHHNNLNLDGHECLLSDDDTIWTLWFDGQIVDMSQYIEGGYPDALVVSHEIQRWDEDHNLLWSWNGHDHLETLPYSGVIDSTQLYSSQFEHLHINSIDIYPDGDLLVSSRILSVIFRIDYETGDVLWRMGMGPLNDFTFSNGTGENVPLTFCQQHDARLQPGDNLTLFDNGGYHIPRRSYARRYNIDEEELTANLIWFYSADSSDFTRFMGSMRMDENGNSLIGWGMSTPLVNGTELDEDRNILWQIDHHLDAFNGGFPTYTYRILKSTMLGTAAIPYVSEVFAHNGIRLFCNWWGHEEEVASYDVYIGQSPDPPWHGNTETGEYFVEYPAWSGIWYVQIIALDESGEEISDFSNELALYVEGVSVDDEPSTTNLPERFQLGPAWPNPFNASTKITVHTAQPSRLQIAVFNVLGQRIATLHDAVTSAGTHVYPFSSADLASGVYIVRAKTDTGLTDFQKITLIR
jgi:Arylsulfotransferase (ASST)/Secretion system C-terminal sorting domain